MIVVSITDCPPALRGDLTKWLFEINVGVYVGQVSARVRDELWNRIVENCKVGRVTMVYQTNNEQHFAFRVHNSDWKPIDFDGLTLMMRPGDGYSNRTLSLRPGFSKAARHQIVKRIQATEARKSKQDSESALEIHEVPQIAVENDVHAQSPRGAIIADTAPIHHREPGLPARSASTPIEIVVDEHSSKAKNKRTKRTAIEKTLKIEHHNTETQNCTYVVIDLETTGLDENEDEIVEFGAIRIVNGQIIDKFQCIVLIDNDIPPFISKLTGITDDMIDENGIPLKDALVQFMSFIGSDLLIGHNIEFDMKFIRAALKRCHVAPITNKTECTLELARKQLPQCKSHKLKSLVAYLGIQVSGEHRSLDDCESVFHLYEKLNQH